MQKQCGGRHPHRASLDNVDWLNAPENRTSMVDTLQRCISCRTLLENAKACVPVNAIIQMFCRSSWITRDSSMQAVDHDPCPMWEGSATKLPSHGDGKLHVKAIFLTCGWRCNAHSEDASGVFFGHIVRLSRKSLQKERRCAQDLEPIIIRERNLRAKQPANSYTGAANFEVAAAAILRRKRRTFYFRSAIPQYWSSSSAQYSPPVSFPT